MHRGHLHPYSVYYLRPHHPLPCCLYPLTPLVYCHLLALAFHWCIVKVLHHAWLPSDVSNSTNHALELLNPAVSFVNSEGVGIDGILNFCQTHSDGLEKVPYPLLKYLTSGPFPHQGHLNLLCTCCLSQHLPHPLALPAFPQRAPTFLTFLLVGHQLIGELGTFAHFGICIRLLAFLQSFSHWSDHSVCVCIHSMHLLDCQASLASLGAFLGFGR